MSQAVKIDVYRWAGQWGPFKVKIPCGECTLTGDIIKDVIETDLKDIPVEVETQDWLSVWWKPLLKGGWHAPIVMVDGQLVSQGVALNRGVLVEAIIRAHIGRTKIKGTHVFGKENCGYCTKAKKLMADHKIDHAYHDVIKEPASLYEMVARAKDEIGHKTPVTTPQIWIDGEYVGGATELEQRLTQSHQE